MTNEEAKVFLLQLHTDKQLNKSEHEALRVAIKALEQTSALDKIKAEIYQLILHKAEFLTSDNKVCIDSRAVLAMIDKYRV